MSLAPAELYARRGGEERVRSLAGSAPDVDLAVATAIETALNEADSIMGRLPDDPVAKDNYAAAAAYHLQEANSDRVLDSVRAPYERAVAWYEAVRDELAVIPSEDDEQAAAASSQALAWAGDADDSAYEPVPGVCQEAFRC